MYQALASPATAAHQLPQERLMSSPERIKFEKQKNVLVGCGSKIPEPTADRQGGSIPSSCEPQALRLLLRSSRLLTDCAPLTSQP